MKLYQVAGVGICKLIKKEGDILTFSPYHGGGDKLSTIKFPENKKKYRNLISIDQAKKLEDRLNNPEDGKISFKSNWRKREKLYQERYTSLDPWKILEIVEELISYEEEKKIKNKHLSHMEKLWLKQSKKILTEEIRMVLHGEKNIDVLCENEAYSA